MSSSAVQQRKVSVGSSNAGSSRTIVVAVDDDQLSWEAVRFTVQEIYRDGDVLHLVHVIPRDSISIPVPHAGLGLSSMSYCETEDFETFLWENATQFIKETMVGLADARKATCEVEIVRGACRQSIGEAICKTAEQLQAALIVVPGRQRPGFVERLFVGDQATFGSYVAKHAGRPTVIYQPQAASVQQQAQQQQEVSSTVSRN